MAFMKGLASFLLLMCWSLKATEAVSYFRNDYQYVPEMQTFYKLHNRTATWSDAFSTCLSEGADLVVPKSQAEYDVVVRLQAQTPGLYLWLGLNDLHSSRNFVTKDGKPPPYTNWLAGEPNNVNERCVMLFFNNQYNDGQCSSSLKFMCSISLNDMTIFDNSRCQTNDMEYIYSARTDKCYKVHTLRKTWYDAYKTCLAEASTLAVISNQDEALVVSRALGVSPTTPDFEQAFIGTTDLLIPGDFVTVDGKRQRDTSFNTWFTPTPTSPDYRCGTLHRSRVLNKYNCNSVLDFVCEKTLQRESCPAA